MMSMDYSAIRQTFEFGKLIRTAGMSILNFIKFSGLVAKYCKMWKIYSPVKFFIWEFCVLLYFTRKSVTTIFPTVLKLFSNLNVCLIREWSIVKSKTQVSLPPPPYCLQSIV